MQVMQFSVCKVPVKTSNIFKSESEKSKMAELGARARQAGQWACTLDRYPGRQLIRLELCQTPAHLADQTRIKGVVSDYKPNPTFS